MVAVSAVTLAIASVIFVAPGFFPGLFFNSVDESAKFFVLFLASTLVGYSILNWMYANSPLLDRRRVAWANLSTLLVATMLSIYGSFTVIDNNAWLIVGQHSVFALGFLPIALIKKQPLKETA